MGKAVSRLLQRISWGWVQKKEGKHSRNVPQKVQKREEGFEEREIDFRMGKIPEKQRQCFSGIFYTGEAYWEESRSKASSFYIP